MFTNAVYRKINSKDIVKDIALIRYKARMEETGNSLDKVCASDCSDALIINHCACVRDSPRCRIVD